MSSFAEYLGVDNTSRPLRIGKSFSWNDTPYHSLRCDFKPAGVDVNQTATLEVGDNNDVSLTVPLEGDSSTKFQGSQKSHLKECVLIFDHTTGEITLERLGSQIQLKKTRTNGTSKFSRPPFPFDKKKLSPMSGGGTPTRCATPPTIPAPKKNDRNSMPTFDSEEEELDDNLGLTLPSHPTEKRMSAEPPPLPTPRPTPTPMSPKSDSSASSESESSSSSSSSDDSSDDDDQEESRPVPPPPPARAQHHNMPVIGDDLELPSAPVQTAPAVVTKRNIVSEDLRLSDSDSDSD